MHFTLQQLKLFESVYRNAGYTHAAKELHLKGKRLSLVARTFLDYILVESHQLLDMRQEPS